ncbi:MAG TPA: helicase-related protein, partial [Burkholderiaceae bacterium]|nr:helicase-related protein [Burkholderiaceae bacterium]
MLLQFPDALPVSAKRDLIADAIAASPVVIVCGETGSGKTTQLPKICLSAGRGRNGLIGHTQPRRLAATTVARRIAEELGTPLGTDVGYKIRFNEKTSPRARVKLMTDGILLAETQGDPQLSQYDTLIIDEAHERSLNIDFLLGYLKQLIDGPRRNDLKLIVTSATIDAQRFAAHFAIDDRPAPVIEVSGRLYPVEIRYRPLEAELAQARNRGRADEEDEEDYPAAIEEAIDELWRERPGDVLVFLPGEREIRDCAEHLRRALQFRRAGGVAVGAVEILPLYSRLSVAEQQRVFAPGPGYRVVLATNVAETSLTVPRIRYVVDTGLARVKRYRYRGKVEQLQIEPISRAAANQRAGRCGRVADGVCVRLYSEEDFAARPEFTDPEVLRSSLASVILRMKSLNLGDIDAFPFLDRPPRKAIADGYDLLH